MPCSRRKPPKSAGMAAKSSNSSATVFSRSFRSPRPTRWPQSQRQPLPRPVTRSPRLPVSRHPEMDDEPPLDIVVALHVGTVHYGNIGAADRLDFTVIGPAVNLVSRIENAAKMLGQSIVVSADLAAALDGVVSLGRHRLRGLATPQELFAPH